MVDKRREKRFPAKLDLKISSLFMQNNVKVENIDAPIQVVDISKSGLAFITESVLPMDFYFNAAINLGVEENATLYTVVKIIRTEDVEGGKHLYGCELVGLAPILSYIFDNYEKSLSSENE